jgi:uncharacterized protein
MTPKLLFTLLALAVPAHAASLECPKPYGIAEKLGCDDPELSTIEAKVTTLLHTTEGKLSPPAVTRLRDGQQAWHKYLSMICPAGPNEADCLKQEYTVRAHQLERATESNGGFSFMRAERFEAHSPMMTEDAAHPVVSVVAWPQLDRPSTPGSRTWNGAMSTLAGQLAAPPDGDAPDTDVTVDYRLASASGELLQVMFSSDVFTHGAVHGDSAHTASIWLIRAARPLKSDDLFDAGKPWQGALSEVAAQALRQQAKAERWPLQITGATSLNDLVTDPTHWLLSKDGLTLHFNVYDVSDYAAGEHEVTIPWERLRPYLVPNPPLNFPA